MLNHYNQTEKMSCRGKIARKSERFRPSSRCLYVGGLAVTPGPAPYASHVDSGHETVRIPGEAFRIPQALGPQASLRSPPGRSFLQNILCRTHGPKVRLPFSAARSGPTCNGGTGQSLFEDNPSLT